MAGYLKIIVHLILSLNLSGNISALGQVNITNILHNLNTTISIKLHVQNIFETCTILFVISNHTQEMNNRLLLFSFSGQQINLFVNMEKQIQALSYIQKFSMPCTVALYFTHLYGLNKLPTNFIPNLPGGIFNSFHVIFLSTEYQLVEYQNFKKALIKRPLVSQMETPETQQFVVFKQMHNLVLVSADPSEPEKARYSTFSPWFQEEIPINPSAENIFPSRYKNLYGEPLLWPFTTNIDQTVLQEYINFRHFRGIANADMSILVEFTTYLNTTPRLLYIPSYGVNDPTTGKWNGYIGALLDGDIHITPGISLKPERLKVVEYGSFYHYDSFKFITSLPEVIASKGSLRFLSKPFDICLWIAFAATFTIILYLLVVRNNNNRKKHKCGGASQNFVLLLLRAILDQPFDSKQPKDGLIRFLLTFWLFTIIILSCLYKSKVISFLLSPTMIYPPKNFKELALHATDYKIGTFLYNESILGSNLRQINSTIGYAIEKRVINYPEISPECYLPVLDYENKQVCLGRASILEANANHHLTDKYGKQLYKISEDFIFSYAGANTVPKVFPHLKVHMDRIAERHFEMGVIKNFRGRQKYYQYVLGRIWSTNTSPSNQKVANEILHFAYLLLLGYGIALIAFLVEALLFWMMK